ncbi:hypothetical protein Kpho02_78130 [Kitasatospora phosalacinea]|uniref:Uncharacterized protein n=1 Tax=Kitasatospora phosalacinea TaxID=2065 RepID=A0A9W6QIG1_9ACTN|nr:hypothetical protein Kpho02_78130 [Kitasatospora phosalacinea]
MLASTVQFSNNDQTSTLGHKTHPQVKPASMRQLPFPQDPTTCPTHPLQDLRSTPPEGQYWQSVTACAE